MCSNVRDVIIVKNIIFDNSGKKVVDHAWQKGRPCIVIGKDENSLYVLPLSTNIRRTPDCFYIPRNKIEYDFTFEGYKKDSEAHLNSVLKINMCGRAKIGSLDETVFLDMMKNLLMLYKRYNNEIPNEIRYESNKIKEKVLI